MLRQAWTNPKDLDAILADLAAGTSIIPLQTTEMNPAMPARRPLGESLLRGGKQALLDFCATAPPRLRPLISLSPSQAVQSALLGLADADPPPDPHERPDSLRPA